MSAGGAAATDQAASVAIARGRRSWLVTAEQTLPQPLGDVFAFFADAANLEAITPPWLGFSILTPAPIAMAAGAEIRYRLRIHGVPIRWRTEITAFDPPHGFVDEQRRGPYLLWRHEHSLRARGSDATLVVDRVRYRPIGGRLVNALVVARDLKVIFEYRQEVLARRFADATHQRY